MDTIMLSAIVTPIATIVAAVGYIVRIEGKTTLLAQKVSDRALFQDVQHLSTTSRLDRIETKVDKVVDVLVELNRR